MAFKTTRISKPQPHRVYDRTSYVLVVDDDDTLLKFFKIHLNKSFSRVIVVDSAKDAMTQLKEKEIDLVLTDITMPKMDGIELMAKVRRFDPTIPVLIISGAILDQEQTEACMNEADGYLRKPFSFEDLHDFIGRGMKLRAAFKEMAEIMRDRKNFRALLRGKISPRRAAKLSKGKDLEEKLNSHLSARAV
jgi:DNA-binding response OmpR family regulator